MLDIFHNDAFSIVRLSVRINDLPYVPGQVSASGLFETDGVDTLSVGIERRPEGLGLVGTTPRGGPGETIMLGQDNMLLIPVPHYQRDDSMNADEVQGRRAFGTEDELETVLQRVDRKVSRHLRDLDATIELQRVGALKGQVYDGKGRLILDLYQSFAVAAPAPLVFHMPQADGKSGSAAGVGFGSPTIRATVKTLRYQIEDALDRPYTGIEAWCGRDFFDAIVNSKEAYETRLRQEGATLRNALEMDDFSFAGVVWHRYRTGAKATLANRGNPFIAANECRFVITGVPDLYITRFAPADYMETVNTLGLPRYVKMWPKDNDKGMNMEIQTNPVSIMTRPELSYSATFDTTAT